MEIIRKKEFDVSLDEIRVGDQIALHMHGEINGVFTATAQRIDDRGVLFMFDNCICEHARDDLEKYLKEQFTGEIELGIPTFGMIFGHDHSAYQYYEPDNDEQLPLMKDVRNRVSFYNGETDWYWLKNRHKQSAAYFAYVLNRGYAYDAYASNDLGVRPVFTIKPETQRPKGRVTEITIG